MMRMYWLVCALICLSVAYGEDASAHHHRHAHHGKEYSLLIESNHTRSKLDQARDLLQSGKCHHVYLDVGTNRGVQIRKLYEPQHYPKAEVKKFFNQYFGDFAIHQRKDTCSFGFEPNLQHKHRLEELQNAYQAQDWPVVIFTETAVAANGHNLTFYPQPGDAFSVGASLFGWKGVDKTHPNIVGSMPLADFILHDILPRAGQTTASKVVMKMDIEGEEYELIPLLLTRGAFCGIHNSFVEYHKFVEKSIQPKDLRTFKADLNYILSRTPNCIGRISTMDDETYGDDNTPLPKKTTATTATTTASTPKLRRV